ncbi:MAG: 3-deoxy-D-manno-octulosonic acid transferase, partial [Synergistaceae bacterium]|nr:3-deoxy-D-manno-octulosonic acid transferase [Synergistaceae bacterium]
VLSTVTETGRSMAVNLIGGCIDKFIYSPWDRLEYVNKALNIIKPKVYITMETELWPEILAQLKVRDIKAFLANGRVSDRGFNRMIKNKSFWGGVLDCFEIIFARFNEDKARFMKLGVSEDKIIVTGDLKTDALLNRRSNIDINKWSWLKKHDAAPLFVAGSTHAGEDDIVIAAFRKIKEIYPDARLAIVPRHPERALMAVAAALPYPELKAELLSRLNNNFNNNIDANIDIVVVDKIGVLFELYAAASAAFVGGSLVDKGGQNPFEPVLFNTPLAHGPFMTNFPDTERMDLMGAARCVHTDYELFTAWRDALKPDNKIKIQDACRKYCSSLGGAADKTFEILKNYL